MNYNNRTDDQNGEYPITQEELDGLALAFQNASQPVVPILEKLLTAQIALQNTMRASNKQIAEQQQTIDQQSKEVKQLKQQIGLQNDRLASLVSWRTITALTLLPSTVIASCLFLFQKLLPPQLDSATLEKIDFLYIQEVKRLSKKKTK